MIARRFIPFVLAAAVLLPSTATALITIEGFYGITRLPESDFDAAVTGARNDEDFLDNSLQMAGADVILDLGLLDIGAIADTSFNSDAARQVAVGGLLGIGFNILPSLKLQAFGEAGAQRYGDFTEDSDIITSSSSEEWFAYLGLRPGISYRFSPEGPSIVLGIWGFVRWDLDSKDVDVTVATADEVSPGSVEFGGTTIGAVARLGFEF